MQRISHPSTTQVFVFTETLEAGKLAQLEAANARTMNTNSFFIGLNVNLM